MAGDERETRGSARWPRTRKRPAAPDWEAFTADMKQGLMKMGVPEADAQAQAARKCERTRLGHDWFAERMEAFLTLQDRAGEAYLRYMEAHPEVDWDSDDAPEVPEPPEEAAAQAIYAEVIAAVQEARWPRHLHIPQRLRPGEREGAQGHNRLRPRTG